MSVQINFILWYIAIVIFAILTMPGCTTVVHGPYNQDTLQNQECYSTLGGRQGYCDRTK